MNKKLDVVLAWFVGGLVGRLIGSNFLVGTLELPTIFGWLSVPIGAGVAWLWVDRKQVVTAFGHAYRTIKRQSTFTPPSKVWSGLIEYLKSDFQNMQTDFGWRVLKAVSIGLFISAWWLASVALFAQFLDLGMSEQGDSSIVNAGVVTILILCMLLMANLLVVIITKDLGWNKYTYDRPQTNNRVRDSAQKYAIKFIMFNPLSILIMIAAFMVHTFAAGVFSLAIKLGIAAWKTIQVVNSSRRTVAMTGAAIGLTISQLFGYNPLICGMVCVIAGLIQQTILRLVEKFVHEMKLNRARA